MDFDVIGLGDDNILYTALAQIEADIQLFLLFSIPTHHLVVVQDILSQAGYPAIYIKV